MKPAPFKYIAAESAEEVLDALTEHGFDAKVLAGGQSLIPTMNFRMAQPAVLIDLQRIEELHYIRPSDAGGVSIGAMACHAEVEHDGVIAERLPLLHATMPNIAHPQIRNRGTFGGSLVHADPAAELPAVCLALNANLRVRNKDGERVIPISEFFLGMFMTALEPEELLIGVDIPAPPENSGWDFREVARRHGDYALAGVASVLQMNGKGDCEAARVVLLSVGEGPVKAVEAEGLLVGSDVSEEAIDSAAEAAATKDIDPPGDIHATSAFRRHLTRVLVKRSLSASVKKVKES